MSISVFLSYPKPSFAAQEAFVEGLTKHLSGRGMSPRTLGVTDYDMDAPLTAIRRLMLESNGLVTVAFRRTLIETGIVRKGTDLKGTSEVRMQDQWLTTPWAHIEPAMAFQLGLPILILRESGVLDDGILERGVTGLYMPEFDLSAGSEAYFDSVEWRGIVGKWEGYVRSVVAAKGRPPALF